MTQTRTAVALLAEGVDRNNLTLYNTEAVKRSPSSRRAWIEIRMTLSVRAL